MYTVNYVDNIKLRTMVYWTTAVFVKLLPLISMITLSSLLVVSIHQRAKVHRPTVKQINVSTRKGGGAGDRDGTKEESKALASFKSEKDWGEMQEPALGKRVPSVRARERSHVRTTYMLLAIMMIYIVTYLPQVSNFRLPNTCAWNKFLH